MTTGVSLFHINNFDRSENHRNSVDSVMRGTALELMDYGVMDIEVPLTTADYDALQEYREFLNTVPTFITVHMEARPIFPQGLDGDITVLDSPPRFIPDPRRYAYANMGKQVESHFMVSGAPNTGKTLVAEVLKHVIEKFAPEAKVYLIDTDDCSFSFYDHETEAAREQHVSYVKTLSHVFGRSPIAQTY